MDLIDKYYETELNTPSDINEHLPTLLKLANDCKTVVEFGTRWVVSTWAFLNSSAESVTMVDIKKPDVWHEHQWNSSKTPCRLEDVYEAAAQRNKKVTFIEGSTLDVTIENTDLLFIDTWHCYEQLKGELDRHAKNVNKYIVMHDVEVYKHIGESYYGDRNKQYEGLQRAIDEFLLENPQWKIKEWYTNNNGLGVLVYE